MERQKIKFLNPNIKIQMSNEVQMAKYQSIFLSIREIERPIGLWISFEL